MGLDWGEVKVEKEEKTMNIEMNRYLFLVAHSLVGETHSHEVIIVSAVVEDVIKCCGSKKR